MCFCETQLGKQILAVGFVQSQVSCLQEPYFQVAYVGSSSDTKGTRVTFLYRT